MERWRGSKDSLHIGVTVIGTVQMVEREEREVWLNFWQEFCQTLTTAVLDIDIPTMTGLARDSSSMDMEGRICMSTQCSNLWRDTSSKSDDWHAPHSDDWCALSDDWCALSDDWHAPHSDDRCAQKTGVRTGDLREAMD